MCKYSSVKSSFLQIGKILFCICFVLLIVLSSLAIQTTNVYASDDTIANLTNHHNSKLGHSQYAINQFAGQINSFLNSTIVDLPWINATSMANQAVLIAIPARQRELMRSVVIQINDTDGIPKSGLNVYAFTGTTYRGVSGISNEYGTVTFTLPLGEYRFRADLNGTHFWSGAENTCTLPGCVTDVVTVSKPVTVTVMDTDGATKAGLNVYAFDGTTYSGYSKVTDIYGIATFTLPLGEYRFRADLNGTHFWSDTVNDCSLPGCESAQVTVSKPVTVTVMDTDGATKAGLNVYAFDGATYSGYSKITDTYGIATFTLPLGEYRFRADLNGTHFWSDTVNDCSLPGCETAQVTVSKPVTVTVMDTDGAAKAGLNVYAFDGATYSGYSKVTDTFGIATFTLPLGEYRFRADLNGTHFWSGAENTCTLPGCVTDVVTVSKPVTVTVMDTDGAAKAGLNVYAFDGATYSGYSKVTDTYGIATFTLPLGEYRFRADLNGTHFWSDTVNDCSLPGCESAQVTVSKPVQLLVQDSLGEPVVDVAVYAFDDATYSGYSKRTNEDGIALFTLPEGDYRFRVDVSGEQIWSSDENHCSIPGCELISVVLETYATPTPTNTISMTPTTTTTNTFTLTPTPILTRTSTPTGTPTRTITKTSTSTMTRTKTPTASLSPTPTYTRTLFGGG